MSTAVSTKSKKPVKQLTDQEIQATYSRLQSELQSLAQKIGELESDSEEHELVLKTLEECVAKEPSRKCFRLIGGTLVERTVKDVEPEVRTRRDGIRGVLDTLISQYKTKEAEFQTFQKDHNIRVVSR